MSTSSTQRFFASALVATALLAGCKKSEDKTASPVAAPKPPPAPDAAPPPAPPSTAVATAATLAAIALPVPPGAPATYKWLDQESTKDGERLAYFGEGTNSWITVEILDCNLPRMKEDAAKPSDQRWADAPLCLDPMAGKLKDYPMANKWDTQRAVKVGHLVVEVSMNSNDKLKAPDLETYLGTVDLAAIAKL